MKAQILNLLQICQSDLSQRERKVKNKDGKERGEKMTLTPGGTHGVMNASVDHSIYIYRIVYTRLQLSSHSTGSSLPGLLGLSAQGLWQSEM